jgi:hypothetical protein
MYVFGTVAVCRTRPPEGALAVSPKVDMDDKTTAAPKQLPIKQI